MSSENKTSRVLRQQLNTQLAKLNSKAEAEIEFLDIVREYMMKRSEIELQYGKSLEKLSKSLQHRKLRKYFGTTSTPFLTQETPISPNSNPRSIYTAFKTLLMESDVQARRRSRMGDALVKDITDIMKDFNKQKTRHLKKNMEYGAKYHQEICTVYDDLQRARLNYEKAAKEAEIAEKRYEDASKRPKSGLQSLKTLVTGKDVLTVIQTLKSKFKQKSRKLNDARNNYLLSLLTYNAMNSQYENVELPKYIEKLDGKYYKVLIESLQSFTELEMDISNTIKSNAEILVPFIDDISAEKETNIFLNENSAVFDENPQLSFDSSSSDRIHDFVIDEITSVSLGNRLGDLIVQDDNLKKSLEEKQEELLSLKQSSKQSINGSNQSINHDTLSIQDVQNAIDIIGCQRRKINYQVEKLKAINVRPIISSQIQLNFIPSQKLISVVAKVLYNYKPINADDLEVIEGDEVEIIQVEEDGWVRVNHIKSGNTGIIPLSYIDKIVQDSENLTSSNNVVALYDYTATDEGELTLKVGDEIQCLEGVDMMEDWWMGKLLRTGETGLFPVLFTKGWENVAAKTDCFDSSNEPKLPTKYDNEVPTKDDLQEKSDEMVKSDENDVTTSNCVKAKVLYNYESECEGELSLEKGEVITNIKQDIGSDTWWEGQGKNGYGQFPSNYVMIVLPEAKSINVGSTVRAVYDYTASSMRDLEFKTGEILTITAQNDPDWLEGEINGCKGLFPVNYVEKI
ncbi:hypothetical protein BC833DRAFT_586959 [Globomyces pollinis-pini]|nr:hypothetical protein BC833DRAFT_586959 [Globomyces pollinis-pini]